MQIRANAQPWNYLEYLGIVEMLLRITGNF